MDNADWKETQTLDGGLALRLPGQWRIDPPGDDEEEVLMALPAEDYQPIIRIHRAPPDSSWASAKDWKLANVIQLQESLPDYRDLGGGEWTVDGREISWHAYSSSHGGPLMMSFLCFFVLAGGEAYAAYCGAEEADFPKYRPMIEAIGRSLRERR